MKQKLITKLAMAFTLLLFISNFAFAVKVKKHRSDHSGIFDGYAKVREHKEETSAGVTIHVYCEGSGGMRCKSDIAAAVPLQHDNGYDLTNPELELCEELHNYAGEVADVQQSGSKTEYITISYSDDVQVTYEFSLVWYTTESGELISEVDMH